VKFGWVKCELHARTHEVIGTTRILKLRSECSIKIMMWNLPQVTQSFFRVERGLCIGLTTLPPSVSRMSQCAILDLNHLRLFLQSSCRKYVSSNSNFGTLPSIFPNFYVSRKFRMLRGNVPPPPVQAVAIDEALVLGCAYEAFI
jgi:hypothetical protein